MNLIVISGGRHPYEESTPVLEEFLTAAGHGVTVTEDAGVLADADAMGQYDALVFQHTFREGCTSTLTPDEQAGFKSFIAGGKGFRMHPHLGMRAGDVARVQRDHRRRMDHGRRASIPRTARYTVKRDPSRATPASRASPTS